VVSDDHGAGGHRPPRRRTPGRRVDAGRDPPLPTHDGDDGGRLGPAPPVAGIRLRHDPRLRRPAPARPARRRSEDGRRPEVAGGAAGRRGRRARLGQVLARAARSLRLGRRHTGAAGALRAAGAAAVPSRPLVLPHALHLPRDGVPLRAPRDGRSRSARRGAARGAVRRALRDARLRGPPPRHAPAAACGWPPRYWRRWIAPCRTRCAGARSPRAWPASATSSARAASADCPR
jgi:hypothetical protein